MRLCTSVQLVHFRVQRPLSHINACTAGPRPWRPIVNIIFDTTALVTIDRSLAFGDAIVRQPDFVDQVADTAVWIGEDGAVEAPLTKINEIAQIARQCGVHARRHLTPQDMGVTLELHNPEYVHPAFAGWSEQDVLSAWASFTEIVGLDSLDEVAA